MLAKPISFVPSNLKSAANTIEIKYLTNPQIFDIYNTYTDTSNYERLRIRANAGSVFTIASEALGTGVVRDVAVTAGNFYIGGTSMTTVAQKLNVINSGIKIERDDGTNPVITIVGSGIINPSLSCLRSRGTLASPTAVLTDDVLLRLQGKGHDGTSYPGNARTWIDFNASENWTSTLGGSRIIFNTTLRGGISQGERMRIDKRGKLCLGGTYEPVGDVNFEGNNAKIVGVERHSTSNTAGSNLTIQAGGATIDGIIHAVNATPTAGGSGYTYGDVLSITTGGTGGEVQVSSVDGSGAVTAIVLRSRGSGYTTGTGKSTTGGTGTGCTVNITTTRTCTDKNGGDLILQSGIATGTGFSSVKIQAVAAGVTGSTDRTPTTHFECGNNKIGFFGGTTVVKQTLGADLTNNVTSGGTDNQIDTWTDLTTYATDAAAIRNAIYQLARTVRLLSVGMRAYNLFT